LFLKAKRTYLVIDLYKVKTARRRDRPAGVPIAGFEGLLEVALRPPPIAHELQGADHRAHLVMQKRPSRDLDADDLAVAGYFEAVERFHWRWRLAFGRAEGGEVMIADESSRGLVHRLGIEGAEYTPGAIALKRKRCAAVDNAVEVGPRLGREAGVEVLSGTLAIKHADRVRSQLRVQRVAHFVGLPVLGEIEMGDLAQRMHACIGPSCPARDNVLAREGLNSFDEAALHRRSILLHLP